MSEASAGQEFRLSSIGMERVCKHDQGRFLFVVGDRKYECSVSEACFLSSRVDHLLSSDYTLRILKLGIEDHRGCFGDVLAEI